MTTLTLATLEQCLTLDDIRTDDSAAIAAAGLDQLTYHLARTCQTQLVELPLIEECRFDLYRAVGKRTLAPLGGGIQINFSEADPTFGLQEYGVRVPVFEDDHSRIIAVDGFEQTEAQLVTNRLGQRAVLRETGILSLDLTLTRIEGLAEDGRIIIDRV